MKREEIFITKSEKFAENIRKDHREEVFAKRRNIEKTTQQQEQQPTPAINIVDPRFQKQIIEYSKMKFTQNQLLQLITAMHSPEIVEQHFGVIGIRKLLSRKDNPPIQIVIDSGLVPKLIKYVQQEDYPQIQLEATWCLANIAAGNQNQCNSIIEKGGIKIFVDLLLSKTVGVVEQAIWALGNISCDSVNHRDSIVKNNGIQNLLVVMEVARSQISTNKQIIDSIIKPIIWTLSHICRVKPLTKYETVEPILDLFSEILKSGIADDVQSISEMFWAFANFSANNQKGSKVDKIQKTIQRGILPLAIASLKNSVQRTLVPAFKIIGNISTGNSQQCDYLFSLSILQVLKPYLRVNKKNIRRQICWIFANLASGTTYHVVAFFQSQNLLQELISKLESQNADVKSQIVFIFSNMTENGDPEMLFKFFKEVELIRLYSEILYEKNSTILLENTIESLFYVLDLGEKFKGNSMNPFVVDLYQLNVIEQMENLQSHSSINVSSKILKIISTYFEIADPFEI